MEGRGTSSERRRPAERTEGAYSPSPFFAQVCGGGAGAGGERRSPKDGKTAALWARPAGRRALRGEACGGASPFTHSPAVPSSADLLPCGRRAVRSIPAVRAGQKGGDLSPESASAPPGRQYSRECPQQRGTPAATESAAVCAPLKTERATPRPASAAAEGPCVPRGLSPAPVQNFVTSAEIPRVLHRGSPPLSTFPPFFPPLFSKTRRGFSEGRISLRRISRHN